MRHGGRNSYIAHARTIAPTMQAIVDHRAGGWWLVAGTLLVSAPVSTPHLDLHDRDLGLDREHCVIATQANDCTKNATECDRVQLLYEPRRRRMAIYLPKRKASRRHSAPRTDWNWPGLHQMHLCPEGRAYTAQAISWEASQLDDQTYKANLKPRSAKVLARLSEPLQVCPDWVVGVRQQRRRQSVWLLAC